MAYLIVIEGENPGERIPLAKVVCFGRGVDMDVVLDDVTASKHHARVVGDEEGGFIIEDLGSSNGTFLNGAQVMSHRLADGDMIKVGATTMRFVGQKPHSPASRMKGWAG